MFLVTESYKRSHRSDLLVSSGGDASRQQPRWILQMHVCGMHEEFIHN